MSVPTTKNVPVTLLKTGDYYYPVRQATGERDIEDGLRLVIRDPIIDRNTGGIKVMTDRGEFTYELMTPVVAREV